ncbi:methylmalonyl-CoA mutase subunit beta [Bacillus tuaregi]|uniref:methylmalonyl-CoA mutase subunit beta n=1 Tax=Bacillus tuaregi TaxID=1816695 RepID=UPI0008F7E92C|nr:methylmalonyl-CoA mutase subunit beta [Bacillus tuaregi]
MSLKEMIDHAFSQQTYEAWKQKAEETLKGKGIDTLSRNTYENIQLKPLYTKEDVNVENLSQFPGSGDFRRGSKPLGYIGGSWEIAQRIDTENAEEFKERLKAGFEKGQTAIAFAPSVSLVKELPELLTEFYESHSLSVNGAHFQNEIVYGLASLRNSEKVSGYVGKDPVSLYAKQGGEKENLDSVYDRLVETMQTASSACPELKTLLVDTTVYHNGGANAIQELAIALATAVHHIEQLKARGIEVQDILSKLVFHFSIGSNFFMEIAKLRGARSLWSKIVEAYHASPDAEGQMVLSADTSWFTKTAYDPYVNLLRASNEAFAAVLGGIQYLHVSPYNEPEGKATAFSDRIARNTQLILKDEARLSTVVDPAGGSWYVESLTNQLIEQAWSLFLEIEEKGGIITVLQSNWLQEQIMEVAAKRQKDISSRKQSIVGTNKYANLDDTPLKVESSSSGDTIPSAVSPIQEARLAEPYEKLRKRAEKLAKDKAAPAVGLICLGKLKHHKVRADFISGFLAPGGIKTERSQELEGAEGALNFIKKTMLNHYVVCGSDDDYKAIGGETIQSIKAEFPHVKLHLAGLPVEEEQKSLLDSGISQFIHVKSNSYDVAAAFLDELEVE